MMLDARRLAGILLAILAVAGRDGRASEPVVVDNYRGWGWSETFVIENDFVSVAVVPAAGGRVMEYSLGDTPSLWVNPKLLGRSFQTNEEAKPNEWRNFGGYRVVPTPFDFVVGADGERTHRWPPPVVWGASPYTGATTRDVTGREVVTVTSDVQELPVPYFDRKSQAFVHPREVEERLRYTRTLSVVPASSVVELSATVTNEGDRPVRRGLMSTSQHPVRSSPELTDGENFWLYIPFDPQHTLDGDAPFRIQATPELRWQYVDRNRRKLDRDNPEHVAKYLNAGTNWKGEVAPGVYGLHYDYDLMSGFYIVASESWACYVNQTNRTAFAKLFEPYDPTRFTYPEHLNFSVYNSGLETGYLESEVRTPIYDLNPGESFTCRETWGAARIPGSPVLEVNRAGIVTRRLGLDADTSVVTGGYGVFFESTAVLYVDRAGDGEPEKIEIGDVIPLNPLILNQRLHQVGDVELMRLVLRIDGSDREHLLDSFER